MPENIQKIIKNILRDIAVDMKDEFDQNFERQAFFSEAWQRRKTPIRDKGRAILTDTGQLRRSIHSKITDNAITFYTDLPYAAIHNDGGEIIVTAKMKKFFRAKAYEAAGTFGRKKTNGTTPKKQKAISDRQFYAWMHTATLTPEAEFWCALSMKPVGSTIKIPRRRFLGTSPEVEQTVRDIIEENITDYIGQAIKFESKQQ